MSSKVICEKHGAHIGVLVCPHLSEAVRAKARASVELRKVVRNIQAFAPVSSVVCSDCIEVYGINLDEVSLLQTDDDLNRLPSVTPICGTCLAEYRALTVQ